MGLVITFSNFILIAYTYVGFSRVILLPQDLRKKTRFLLKILFGALQHKNPVVGMACVDRVSARLAAILSVPAVKCIVRSHQDLGVEGSIE
ncbi:hypothetical protein QUB70_22500 [Microcoleus sp. A003_D6]|uniref:hypothetical protein n=1 Tax=Microcoleus sp. A003_D6 TaxID=3055266 RepID=UPI002FD1D9FB